MKTAKTLVRILLLLLILCIGSVTGYQVIGAIQNGGINSVTFGAYALIFEAGLEIFVLAWLYRWLDRPTTRSL